MSSTTVMILLFVVHWEELVKHRKKGEKFFLIVINDLVIG